MPFKFFGEIYSQERGVLLYVAGVAARFALLDALRQRQVAVFGPRTPGQTITPNGGNVTQKRDIFRDSLVVYASRISIADRAPRCIADHGEAEAAAQQQQHSSSGGGDVAAAAVASFPMESWAVVLCLRCGCLLYTSPSPRD